MRKAIIFINSMKAAEFIEHNRKHYELKYLDGYRGNPLSMTLPIKHGGYEFNQFPPYFEGVLPEGSMLEALLKTKKIDRDDLFSQLLAVGADLVGHATVMEEK